MNDDFYFSDEVSAPTWSEAGSLKPVYGPKGAMLAALPKLWTPPFVAVAARVFADGGQDGRQILGLGEGFISRVRALGEPSGRLIVRSSVVGETIWDRGRYQSFDFDTTGDDFTGELTNAVRRVLASAPGKLVSVVIQRYVRPRARGEFGNLLRVSKTRDHWELSTETSDGSTARTRFNTQRDEAASPSRSIEIRPRVPRERLFGAIAAWLNSYLLRGSPVRVNCEWITDNDKIYVVQIDEEDEDFVGVNPFQLRISPAHRALSAKGALLARADGDALNEWDKLKVLHELWEPEALHKPTLFYVSLGDLVTSENLDVRKALEADFRSLIGPENIVVRTSVRSGVTKPPNYPRTEGVRADEAAVWCLERCAEFRAQGAELRDLAFVTHPFIPARSSAWVRADPDNPIVEIHCLWGLPDALQYCPYDIWEVHIATGTAVDYPDYKSNMLISTESGGWEYVRVKNELARNLSVGRREAIDLAVRTSAIARRLGRGCHVMWFVGCVAEDGSRFSLPWYWNEAHRAERNSDRSNYKVHRISSPDDLEAFKARTSPRSRQAIELAPIDRDLMRNTKFIAAVGGAAKAYGIPVILAGSTLAHAYYQLSAQGCMVVSSSEKDRSRVRRSMNFGKLIRDKIPARIAERKEAEVTRKLPSQLIKGFLTSKLIEEAIEVRNAEGVEQKTIELADLYEVVMALIKAEGLAVNEIVAKADEKRENSGGFDEGIVLLQTAILGIDQESIPDFDRPLTQVLARKISEDEFDLPFSFFGFMELDQPMSLVFANVGVQLDVVLKPDRIELRITRGAEQLELPLNAPTGSAGAGNWQAGASTVSG